MWNNQEIETPYQFLLVNGELKRKARRSSRRRKHDNNISVDSVSTPCEVQCSLRREFTTPQCQIDSLILGTAIPYSALNEACDELLLTVLRSEKYHLFSIDELDRVVFCSRASKFIFYIDLICLGEEPGTFQIFAYSLAEFGYGPL